MNKRISIITIILFGFLLGYAHPSFASKEIDSLKVLLRTTKQDTNRVHLIIEILANKLCDTTETLSYIEEGFRLSEKLGWEKGIVLCEQAKAKRYKCMGEYDKAIALYIENGERAKKAKLYGLEADQYRCVGKVYEDRTRYKEAIFYHEKALAIYRRIKSTTRMNSLGDLGNIYSVIEDIPRALDCYKQALEVGRTIKANSEYERKSIEVVTLLNIGSLYTDMERYDDALKNYEDILLINEKLKDNYIEAITRKCMGDMYVSKKQPEKAIASFERSIQLLSETEVGLRPVLYLSVSDLYLDKGEVEKAENYINKAGKIITDNRFDDYKPLLYMTKGRLLTEHKKYPDAIQHLEEAIKLCKESGSISSEAAAWEILYKIYEQAGQTVKAYDAYKSYIAANDSMETRQNRKAVYQKEMQYDFDKKKMADSVKYAQERQVAGLKLQKQRVYTIGGFTGLLLLLLLVFFVFRNYRQQKKANAVISIEKHRSEELLLNILPTEVADELKEKGSVQAKAFEEVTVLFTDFVNFTTAGEKLTPQELVNELHTCFKAFDEIIGKHHIEKIKTVGDAYLAVSGLPVQHAQHAENMVRAAIEIRDYMLSRKQSHADAFEVRIGIHSGNIVAGIVGIKKFSYDIWGDTVNTAARMEQNSERGKINISEATYELVKDKFACTYRGELEAKNKGKLKMYFIE